MTGGTLSVTLLCKLIRVHVRVASLTREGHPRIQCAFHSRFNTFLVAASTLNGLVFAHQGKPGCGMIEEGRLPFDC
jgi:hypothetical protein